jgi:hypothetical protein
MVNRIIRTRQDEDQLHDQFIELMSHVKPIPYDVDCIRIMKKVKRAVDYNRLLNQNKGNLKNEKTYRYLRYREEKDCLSHIKNYLKSKYGDIH